MTRIAVVDHGAGNLVSICQGLEHVGAEVTIITDPDWQDADGVVLPGVGATGAAMTRLADLGFVETLRAIDRPLLGICVGMQVLFDRSAEDDTECLGLMAGSVEELTFAPRLPHMGWNQLDVAHSDPLFVDVPAEALFYFVHSYAPVPVDPTVVVATAHHGNSFVAAVRHGPLWGVQFHPERSGPAGLILLSNFVQLARAGARAA